MAVARSYSSFQTLPWKNTPRTRDAMRDIQAGAVNPRPYGRPTGIVSPYDPTRVRAVNPPQPTMLAPRPGGMPQPAAPVPVLPRPQVPVPAAPMSQANTVPIPRQAAPQPYATAGYSPQPAGPSYQDPYAAPGLGGGGRGGRGQGAWGSRKRAFQSLLGWGPEMEDAIRRMMGFSDPETLAPEYAAEQEQLSDYYDQAEGRLAGNLQARGLGESSAMTSGLGALAGERASGMGGLNSRIAQEARKYAAGLPSLFLQMMMGGGQLAGQHIQDQLTREQIEAMQGSWFDDLMGGLGAIGGAAGSYFGSLPRGASKSAPRGNAETDPGNETGWIEQAIWEEEQRKAAAQYDRDPSRRTDFRPTYW